MLLKQQEAPNYPSAHPGPSPGAWAAKLLRNLESNGHLGVPPWTMFRKMKVVSKSLVTIWIKYVPWEGWAPTNILRCSSKHSKMTIKNGSCCVQVIIHDDWEWLRKGNQLPETRVALVVVMGKQISRNNWPSTLASLIFIPMMPLAIFS